MGTEHVTFIKEVVVKNEKVASAELKSKSVTAVIGVVSCSQSHIFIILFFIY